MDLKGNKLLILGGTALSFEIIKQAKQQGVYVIITDYSEYSPGKEIADKSFKIPIYRDKAESLNVASCGAILMYLSHQK